MLTLYEHPFALYCQKVLIAFNELASSQRAPAADPSGVRETKALEALGAPGLSERQYLDAVGDLVTYGTEASVGPLRDALAWTDSGRVRRAAVIALGRIGSPAAIDAIIASGMAAIGS